MSPRRARHISAIGRLASGRAWGAGMRHELEARREQIQILIRASESELRETRNSAALGGHSRAVLLHLERRLHAGKRDLALLDLQLAEFASADVGET